MYTAASGTTDGVPNSKQSFKLDHVMQPFLIQQPSFPSRKVVRPILGLAYYAIVLKKIKADIVEILPSVILK